MKFKAKSEDTGLRLDVWLNRQMPGFSRSRVQALIRAGNVLVDGHRTRSHCRVTDGLEAHVEIPAPVPTELVPENIPLEVLHEDSFIVVLNKPAGLVVHPAGGHWTGTLANALLAHCKDLAGIGGEMRPGIVHRLDRDTTGAMVVAKNDRAMEVLARQFKKALVHKEYVALVHGAPDPATGRIETMIGRSRHDRKKMSTKPVAGRRAVTNYEVAERFKDCSLVRLVIETGRTHQIRVHMTHIGHPVVGDQQYGRKRGGRRASAGIDLFAVPRQMLHAEVLRFKHPKDMKPVEFRAPLPGDMADLLARLRGE